jgi:uncharacterized protein YkwD
MLKKLLPILLVFSLAITSCIKVASNSPATATVYFVTSTLPSTQSLVSLPSATATAGLTMVAPTLAITAPPNCKVVAVLIEDVTIPDGTKVEAGKKFTKTWMFKNTGTCPWTGYTLAFVSGDRMSAPDSAPVPQTLAGHEVNISVDLVAPSADGSYTGNFELQDATGKVVPIGLEKTFWVKIVVGAGGFSTAPAAGGGTPISVATRSGNGANCQSSENGGYINQLLSLINAARADAGVPAVSLNFQLSAAAQAHSLDMACNNFNSHTGSDGSSIDQRISAAGYSPSYYVEIIAIGTPQNAIAQWNAEASHRLAMIDPKATEIGIGYVYSANSDFGGYFTVDLARP